MSQFLGDFLALIRSFLGPLFGSLRKNLSLAVLSLALAFALWISITDTENPIRTGVPPFDIPVEAVNVPPDVVVGATISPIRVRVEVAEDEWDSLTPADFRATADLFGLPEGTHQVSVRAEALSGRGGLRITQVIPEKAEVVLKPLFSKSVTVVVEVMGEPLRDHKMGTPEPESSTVIVSGPEELVSLVREAVAQVDVTDQTRDLITTSRLRALDGLGRSVEGVVLEPSVMNIRVPVSPTEASRVLLASPTLEGSPAPGYNVLSVSLEPSAVTAVGPPEALLGLSVIRTKGIDISGANADLSRRVSLEVPSGVSVLEGAEVMVTVRIAPAQGQAAFQVPLSVENLSPDLRLASPLPSLQVALSGPVPVLSQVRPSDIVATLDLKGLPAGRHSLQPRVRAPTGLTVASLSPSMVEVVLEPKP